MHDYAISSCEHIAFRTAAKHRDRRFQCLGHEGSRGAERLLDSAYLPRSRLNTSEPLLVFPDHGFRLTVGGSRYEYGGPSALERTVAIFVLQPLVDNEHWESGAKLTGAHSTPYVWPS